MCGDIDVVFTECDQCHPRCMSKVLCMQKERALSDSENKMPGARSDRGRRNSAIGGFKWKYKSVKEAGDPRKGKSPLPHLQG